jgi:hypothetical protein
MCISFQVWLLLFFKNLPVVHQAEGKVCNFQKRFQNLVWSCFGKNISENRKEKKRNKSENENGPGEPNWPNGRNGPRPSLLSSRTGTLSLLFFTDKRVPRVSANFVVNLRPRNSPDDAVISSSLSTRFRSDFFSLSWL